MNITIFGDVHGNICALEKLFKIEENKTDLFVCHGDIVNYGPWSNECVEFLSSRSNCIILRGNHENYFINGSYDGNNEIANSFFNFCIQKFNKNLIHNLRSLEDQYIINDNFRIKHTLNNQYIFEDSDLAHLRINSNYIIGHSHYQFQTLHNDYLIVNTGSLGQNRKYINQACYVKLDSNTLKFTLENYLFNVDLVINQMIVSGYPEICINYYRNKNKIVK